MNKQDMLRRYLAYLNDPLYPEKGKARIRVCIRAIRGGRDALRKEVQTDLGVFGVRE